jgi:hypothetical protein
MEKHPVDAPMQARGSPRAGEHAPAHRMRGMKSLIASIATVFGWFALSVASVVVILVALWITSALARAQAPGDLSAPWLTARTWGIAALMTLGAPLALTLWKHGGDRRRVASTLGWLPLVWNLCALGLSAELIPDLVGTSLRQHSAWFIIDRVGDSHTWTRYLSALGHNPADLVDPLGDEEPPRRAVTTGGNDLEDAITVPFSADGNAILMDVELEGPGGSATYPYLFDTGASFTTISSAAAERLGIDVPDDAPTLQFNTASGPRESRMVYLPALRLGDVALSGLLVSVCDGCTNDRSDGLLGLNVIREFLVQMDYQSARMRLIPRIAERPNRAYDIGPAVDLEIEGRPEIWLGRVRWVVLVENRSTVPLEGVVPEINFSDGLRLRGAAIERIEPGAVGRSLVEGKTKAREGGELGFTLTISEAYW